MASHDDEMQDAGGALTLGWKSPNMCLNYDKCVGSDKPHRGYVKLKDLGGYLWTYIITLKSRVEFIYCPTVKSNYLYQLHSREMICPVAPIHLSVRLPVFGGPTLCRSSTVPPWCTRGATQSIVFQWVKRYIHIKVHNAVLY